MFRGSFLILAMLLISFAAEARNCHAILYAADDFTKGTDPRFFKTLSGVHGALKGRGCKNIQVVIGDGKESQQTMKTFKEPFSFETTNIAALFPGSPLHEMTDTGLTTAFENVLPGLAAGDTVLVHIFGHSIDSPNFAMLPNPYDSSATLSRQIDRVPKNVKVQVVHDSCYAGGMIEVLKQSNACVFVAQNVTANAIYSSAKSYTQGFIMAYMIGMSITDAHTHADVNDFTVNRADSSLDRFLFSATGANELNRIAAHFDRPQTTSIVQDLRVLGLNETDSRTLMYFLRGRALTDIARTYNVTYRANKDAIDGYNGVRSDWAKRFPELYSKSKTEVEGKEELKNAEFNVNDVLSAFESQFRELDRRNMIANQRSLRAAYLLRFGSEEQKARLRELLECSTSTWP